MKTIELLRWFGPYFESGVLLGFAWLALLVLENALLRGWFRLSASAVLRAAHGLLLGALILPGLAMWIPRQALLRPSVQVWTGPVRSALQPYGLLTNASLSGWKVAAPRSVSSMASREYIFLVICACLCVVSVFLITRFALQLLILKRRLEDLPVIRAVGQVRVAVSDDELVPFAAWWPGRAWVVLPVGLIGAPSDSRIVVKHELQHHRQGDSRWLYVVRLLRTFFFWNPAVYGLDKVLSRLQEVACDEVLVGRRKISPQAYGSCLLQAAQSAVGSRSLLVGTTGMAASASGTFLKRRIEMLFNDRQHSSREWFLMVFAVGTFVFMASAAFAARGVVLDRTLTMGEARALALKSSKNSEIPITVNELVLAKLNRYIGTPDGRKWVKEALAQMPLYRKMIERKLEEYEAPEELLATAMYESGFENGNQSPAPSRAAGIWQFIASTARRYDLVVNDHLDERLNPEKETVAAMRYLRDLNREFHDWRLALKAYSEGESRLRGLIEKYGTRDPWELERLDTTEHYLSGTMAMILIFKNPSLVD